MLLATLGVVAALAFVLGLGALCLWALKRWGRMSLTSRTRIAVEVVQRIPLGPKTGLAVVRVGEKVMAVSVGDGGIRTLFELDEADRQRVIASSHVPTPMDSSQEAMASYAKFVPGAFGRSMAKAMAAAASAPASTPVLLTVPQHAAGFSASVNAKSMRRLRRRSPHRSAEILSFITAPVTGADREFRRMLGGALSAPHDRRVHGRDGAGRRER
jgi:flagellar biogenesis protein FliO